MTLARARRAADPERAAALLDQAHSQSQELIEEVRQAAWRIYPTALDQHGLASALDGDRAATEPDAGPGRCPAEGEVPPAVESAAYFVALAKRSPTWSSMPGPTIYRITVVTVTEPDRRVLRLNVVDDGIGGADPEGGGLQGLGAPGRRAGR